jgi:DNA-binding LytR/AlgR family response regulator
MVNTPASAMRALTSDPIAELRLGLGAWVLFILATCAYCLIHQAFVSAVTPDVGHTVTLALREWGIWAVLAPWALRDFRRIELAAGAWKASLPRCIALGFVAACVPTLIDQLTGDRNLASSLALFWPRNFAMAVLLYFVWRVFRRPVDARPAATPSNDAPEPSRTLLVSKGADQCLIRVADIQHASAAGNYIDICARDQRYLLRATMADLEDLLPTDDFVRIHRSHIVRVVEIERIRIERSGSGTVHLRGGGKLAISKSYRAHLKRHQETLKPQLH